MRRISMSFGFATVFCLLAGNAVEARGFGGFRAGGFGGGGGFAARSFGGFEGARSFGGFEGARGGLGATGSYDRSWTGSRGGTINTEGNRGFASGPLGGFAAGGTRDTTVTGPQGRTYSGSREAG